jgi:hypothetical protein
LGCFEWGKPDVLDDSKADNSVKQILEICPESAADWNLSVHPPLNNPYQGGKSLTYDHGLGKQLSYT